MFITLYAALVVITEVSWQLKKKQQFNHCTLKELILKIKKPEGMGSPAI